MVSSTPRPYFTPGKDPVPILQEAGWAPGSVYTGGKSRPHRDSIPDSPARIQPLYWLSYRAHIINIKGRNVLLHSLASFVFLTLHVICLSRCPKYIDPQTYHSFQWQVYSTNQQVELGTILTL